ncbi:histidine kinase dimerization/phospho-acceptor domain-containing protein [Motilimonas pumila]|uniref:histidine kinase n=1 Tax=Motilimonas pumila TaxID=2303987 RepID=A0A418YD53_9GAMM|nr:histidine kinase dimerization/phospho-acceptor domain-containing protein [Motilimonas pumila]RJG42409.1 hypothetical protein D1Z90_13120 [Motilimonas pumila]
MKLKTQLLLVSLLMLSLPWAGCQSMKEIANVMAENQKINLSSALTAAAVLVDNQSEHIPGRHHKTLGRAIYAVQGKDQVNLDGYDNDWLQPVAPQLYLEKQHRKLAVQAQYQGQQLYLKLTLTGPPITYFGPNRRAYDAISLKGLGKNDQVEQYLLRTEAPGEFYLQRKTHHVGQYLSSYPAYWRETDSGTVIELALPLAEFSHGISIRWQYPDPIHGLSKLGTNNTFRPLLYQHDLLDNALQPLTKKGLDIFLVDQAGWLLSQAKGETVDTDIAGFWLLESLYAWLLENKHLPDWRPLFKQSRLVYPSFTQQVDQATWFKEGYRRNLLLVQPVTLGQPSQTYYLVGTQQGEVLIRMAGSAFTRLFLISLVVIFITTFALFAYASWLSWRIKKLSASASSQLQGDGQYLGHLPLQHDKDELGTLARSFASLLNFRQQQTDYLSQLASKLSHEIRTPLAVIRSSLDNLQHSSLNEEQQQYVQRANDGCSRLSKMISAMSEAKRLEQSLQDYDREDVPIVTMLEELTAMYQQTWPEHDIQFDNQLVDHDIKINLYPELLVQALDKLMDNAVDFAGKENAIALGVKAEWESVVIFVHNQGSSLPDAMGQQIFESLISVRQGQSSKAHLGLGLHLVSLIAKHHGFKVSAKNQQQGVVFSLSLPTRH